MGLTSARLRRGFLPVLQLIMARAVLNTSSWRVEVDPDWVAQHVVKLPSLVVLRNAQLHTRVTAPEAHTNSFALL